MAELVKSRFTKIGIDQNPALHALAISGRLPRRIVEHFSYPTRVEELEAVGVVQVIYSGKRCDVELAHPVYGEVLNEEISILRRRAICRELIELVEELGTRRREDPLRVATWRLEAFGTADPQLLIHAAQLARHAHDYPQVISLLNALPEHSSYSKLLYGEALVELAEWQKAEECFVESLALASSEEERLHVYIARTMNMLWSNAETLTALSINNEARKILRSTQSEHVLDLNDAAIRTVSGEVVYGIKVLEQRLEDEADKSPNLNVWLTGAIMKGVGLTAAGFSERALNWSRKAYRQHRATDESALVPHPASQLITTCFALAESGKLSDAREVGEEAFSTLLAARAPLPRIWTAYFLGRAEWHCGHPKNALQWFTECAVLSKMQNQDRALCLAFSSMAAAAAILGDVDQAREYNNEAKTYPAIGFLAGLENLGEIWIYAAEGRLKQAREVLQESIDVAQSSGHVAAELQLLVDLARLGDAPKAAAIAKSRSYSFESNLYVAFLDFVTSLSSADPLKLEEVAKSLAEMGADLLSSECWIATSRAWQKTGRSARSADFQQVAAKLAKRCQGAQTPLLSSVGANASLTAREREIALMAAKGASSREIATSLGISIRTANNHLQRIFTKLGIASRRDIAQHL
ncbi:LuxR C-terminal-related transcriptional regulator [Streptomyces sp. NPDC001286]